MKKKSDQIQNWIKNHAHKDHGVQQAPEAAVWADGDYNQLLIHKVSVRLSRTEFRPSLIGTYASV